MNYNLKNLLELVFNLKMLKNLTSNITSYINHQKYMDNIYKLDQWYANSISLCNKLIINMMNIYVFTELGNDWFICILYTYI